MDRGEDGRDNMDRQTRAGNIGVIEEGAGAPLDLAARKWGKALEMRDAARKDAMRATRNLASGAGTEAQVIANCKLWMAAQDAVNAADAEMKAVSL